jgi:hypothetical protein
MIKSFTTILAVAFLTLSFAGSVFAEMIKGTVSKVENEGRAVSVKAKDGKEVTLRISGSGTTLSGVGDRGEIKAGMKAEADYDPGDRNTAKTLKLSK